MIKPVAQFFLVAVVLSLGMTKHAAALDHEDAATSSFAYKMTIQIATSIKGGVVECALPKEVLANAKSSLCDLRLFDHSGKALQFITRKDTHPGEARLLPDVQVINKKGSKQTELLIDYGIANPELSELVFNFEDANFKRSFVFYGRHKLTRVHTQYREDAPPIKTTISELWSRITSGYFSRTTTRRGVSESLKISAGSRYRYMRVVISNNDDAPLTFFGIKVRDYGWKIIFPNTETSVAYLYYGSEQTGAAKYDFVNYENNLRQDGVTTAAVGGIEQNSHQEVRPPVQAPWTERNGWLMGVAVIAAVLALGYLVVKQVRQLTETKADSE